MTTDDDCAEIDVPHWFEIDSQIRQICTGASIGTETTRADKAAPRKYVVMLTSGVDDGGKRATLAFSAACAAISMDFDTLVFLIGDGSDWAYEDACAPVLQPGFPPLTELVDSFLNLGGRIYLCAACDQESRGPGRAKGETRRRHKVQASGLAPFLVHMVGSTCVTF